MAAVLEGSLGRLEEGSSAEALKESRLGHARLLLDGLYAGALAAAEAVPTGVVESRFFGVLMSWYKDEDVLRVRSFRGVFSEDVILRPFPVTGRNSGVGSKAFHTNGIVVANSTTQVLHARDEGRLRAIYAVPIQSRDDAVDGDVVVLCINSVEENAFELGEPSAPLQQRLEALKRILRRINALGRVMGGQSRVVDSSATTR